MHTRLALPLLLVFISLIPSASLNGREPDKSAASGNSSQKSASRVKPAADGLLATEQVVGDGVWVDPVLKKLKARAAWILVNVWFDEQFLGDGNGYRRRAKEFSSWRRLKLRDAVAATLKALSERSYQAAKADLDKLLAGGTIRNFQRHWIVNGFSCAVKTDALDSLKSVHGVKKIFAVRGGAFPPRSPSEKPLVFKPVEREKFDPGRYKHPWYIRYLLADKVWKEFGVTGEGTLNIVHDFNFLFSDNVTTNLYRNADEIPGNEKDDDGNGLVDDYHGYNFDRKSAKLRMIPQGAGAMTPQGTHGFLCAAIICGTGLDGEKFEFGIAPRGRWAGVIASGRLEAAIQWAIEQGADTYSMSFSLPGLGEYRSHWRKIMEHGSFCGVYFVSGAGNFAQRVPVPVQMRTPEDIPDVVFAAAGVQRDFSRTPFSSKGPVKWETEHYHDGLVQKPEVCAFNNGLPALLPDGTARPAGASGNSFAGPMFCGSIALMLSADPDLLPWDLKEIITSTATDVAAKGVDDETGHGLINCYRAVKEVLRRKAVRDGKDPSPFTGRQKGDALDIKAMRQRLKVVNLQVGRVQPNSQAAKLGIKSGDVIVRYNKTKVTSQQGLRAAKTKAARAKLTSIPLVIRRDGKDIDLQCKPGPLGIILIVKYDDPTFQ